MIIKLPKKIEDMTEDELDVQAFEKDVELFDYLDRVEKGELSPEEKKGREWEADYLEGALNEASELIEKAKERKGFTPT